MKSIKRSVSIAFFLVCIIAGLVIGGAIKNKTTKQANMRVVESANIAATPTPALPQTITIPKIHVTAPIEQVGIDSQGRMDVPKKAMDTGWYDAGFRPGANGNAVIDGHLDLASGAPAVFWYIKNLQQGDQITVTDTNNKQYHFVVTNTTAYAYDKFPSNTIFAPSSSPHLILITCNGTWDKTSHNYSKRLVVYADLQQ